MTILESAWSYCEEPRFDLIRYRCSIAERLVEMLSFSEYAFAFCDLSERQVVF